MTYFDYTYCGYTYQARAVACDRRAALLVGARGPQPTTLRVPTLPSYHPYQVREGLNLLPFEYPRYLVITPTRCARASTYHPSSTHVT